MVVDYLSKTKEEDKYLKKQDIQDIFFQNELDKVCIQHDIAYRDFIDFTRRAASDKTIKHYMIKLLVLLKIQNMMDITVDLLS